MHSTTLLSSGFSLLSILSIASATCKTFTPTTTPIKLGEEWGWKPKHILHPLTGRITSGWTSKGDYIVSPGENRTYVFAARLLTIEGKADGCEDPSLNNMLLKVMVPQLNANGTSPLGYWVWSSSKITPITPTPSPTPSGVTPTVTPTTAPKSEGVERKAGGILLALVAAGACAVLL
ncbi:hypothetical protein B0J14DRAFT_557920 [Halenospora varia]|nr:hypothetical protein B0J14DRAFT_557920 [Halenospora varia]